MSAPQPPPVAAVLAAAFVLRLVISALIPGSLHPDEIMQYLEPAHEAVFGAGVRHWEQVHGARPWWIPGFAAACLRLLDALGLSQPAVYVPFFKSLFSLLSLTVPLGMYRLTAERFGAAAGSRALLLGAFWHDLVLFAPRPLSESIATSLLFLPWALRARNLLANVAAAAVFALAVAIRPHYLPVAVLFGFWHAGRRWPLALTAALGTGIVLGAVDDHLWDGGWFHSYRLNLCVNLHPDIDWPAPTQPPAAVLFTVTSLGLMPLAAYAALQGGRRHPGFGLALLIALLAALDLAMPYREPRFLFLLIPLWLILLAGLPETAGNLPKPRTCWRLAAAASAVWLALCTWPQTRPYLYPLAPRTPPGLYAAAAADPRLDGLWDTTHDYSFLPGYFHLHRPVPYYDRWHGEARFGAFPLTVGDNVSHVITAAENPPPPGFRVQAEAAGFRLHVRHPQRRTRPGDRPGLTPYGSSATLDAVIKACPNRTPDKERHRP